MFLRIVLFLILNFGALALGSYYTSEAVKADWYMNLNKAPWTPPGWFFGFAWSVIMICFSVYLSILWGKLENKQTLLILFIIQWILNVGWNPTFFYYQNVVFGLLIIISLTILITFILFKYHSVLMNNTLYILPYFLWLLVATSLNAYIWINN